MSLLIPGAGLVPEGESLLIPGAGVVTSAGGGGATLTADSGTYTLSGTAATLKAGRKLAANSVTYAISGTPVTLTWSGAPVVVIPDNPTSGGGVRSLIKENRLRRELDDYLQEAEEKRIAERIIREDEEIVIIMAALAA